MSFPVAAKVYVLLETTSWTGSGQSTEVHMDDSNLMRNVRSFLRSRQRRPETVKRYFHERHVRYAAA